MNRKIVPMDERESRLVEALLRFSEGEHAESEQYLLQLLSEARQDADRYFPCLYYGERLIKMGRLEDARDILLQSAQIALRCKELRWLMRAHEALGDLSAAEANWFGALHHYRYALRNAAPASDRATIENLEDKIHAVQITLHADLSRTESVLALSKEYVSGNMTVSFVHRDIYLKKYFARCLECTFCHDSCCSFGADIDILNVGKIEQRKEEILPFIRPSTVEWFEPGYAYYEEYAGNQYTRINPQGPRCVFISKDQRGCGLHRYALSKQMDYHAIKPLVCILFPLSFGEGILSLAPELDDNSLVCSGAGDSAYRSIRMELEYYFGPQFVEELDAKENEVLGNAKVL